MWIGATVRIILSGGGPMQRAMGLTIPETLAEAAAPEATAVIVYDMQVGILSQMPHAPAVLEKVLRGLELARSAGVRVFFMRHLSLPKRLSGVFQLRQMMAWQRKVSVDDVH